MAREPLGRNDNGYVIHPSTLMSRTRRRLHLIRWMVKWLTVLTITPLMAHLLLSLSLSFGVSVPFWALCTAGFVVATCLMSVGKKRL